MTPDAKTKSLSSRLVWYSCTRLRLYFKGSCLKQEDRAIFIPKNIVNLFTVYEYMATRLKC